MLWLAYLISSWTERPWFQAGGELSAVLTMSLQELVHLNTTGVNTGVGLFLLLLMTTVVFYSLVSYSQKICQ